MKTLRIILLFLLTTLSLATCPAEHLYVDWPETEPSDDAIEAICPANNQMIMRFCTASGWTDVEGDCQEATCATETIEDRVWPSTNAGQTATLNCASGFSGTYSRICSTSGTWESETNTCVQLTCVGESLEGNTWPTTNAGSDATLDCAEGFSGSITRTCTLTGTWGTVTNSCVQLKCSAIGIWPETNAGTTVTLPCEDGYIGEQSRECRTTGKWGLAQNTCTLAPTVCASIVDGGYTWPETTIGSTATQTCPVGTTGSITKACQEGGVWGDIINNCSAIQCTGETVNNIVFPTTAQGQTATGTCPENTVGTPTRLCSIGGIWGDIQGECIQTFTHCNSESLEGNNWPSTLIGSDATLSCPSGQTGSLTRPCGIGGVWGTVVNTCVQITCPTENDMTNLIIWPVTNAGQTATQSCGLVPTKQVTRVCSITGTWETMEGNCDPLPTFCAAESLEGNEWPQTNLGVDATLPCAAGYSGSLSRTCSTSGTWSNVVDTCVRITCASEIDTVHIVIWPITNAGETATQSCTAVPTKQITRTCSITGTWETVQGNCDPLPTSCTAESLEGNEWPQTPVGTDATLSCPTGQAGSITRPCSNEGVWGTVVNTCANVYCSAAVDAVHSLIWPQTQVGQTATVTCPTVSTKQLTRPCLSENTWGDIVGDCTPEITHCNAESLEGNEWPMTVIGTDATLSCPAGYSGSIVRTCGTQGVWGSVVNNCVAQYCSSVDDSVNAVTWPQTQVGQTATMTCPTVSTKQISRPCLSENTWGDIVGDCTPIITHCNSVVEEGNEWPMTLIGQSASLECSIGYSGSILRPCGDNGVWGAVNNTCQMNQCPENIVGNITWPLTNMNTTVSNNCQEGYEGSITRYCNIQGTWEDQVDTCTIIVAKCTSELYQDHQWPQTNEGTSASIPCGSGMTGTYIRECLATGIWSTNVTNTCGQIFCPATTIPAYNETIADGTVTKQCAVGFEGSISRHCNITGIWEDEVNTCVQTKCLPTEHDSHSFPATSVNTTASISCPTGYAGTITYDCLDGFIWSNYQNTCSLQNCPAVEYNGYNFTETGPGVTVSLPCSLPFEGFVNYTCSSTMQWENFVNGCRQTYCEASVEGHFTFPLTPAGEQVVLECQPLYTGNVTKFCTNDAVWAPTINNCEAIMCPAETIGNRAWVSVPANFTSSFDCMILNPDQTGYVYRKCGLNGVWESEDNQCVYNAPTTFTYPQSSYTYLSNATISIISSHDSIFESCDSLPDLPDGLEFNSDCTIRGAAIHASETQTYLIEASNSGGVINTNITLTFTDDKCVADSSFDATSLHTTKQFTCYFLGKEVRTCTTKDNIHPEWKVLENDCNMWLYIWIAVIVGVVLILILLIIICICCCGNSVTKYPKKRALQYSTELIGV
ncbi:hypothetical protein WA158_005587 [Blastocystis sp. Blastoise]